MLSVPTRQGLRERNKAVRRERILDGARSLLREGPDTALTTERIAARAEVAPATVYNLIGPRDKVWEALAGWFMDELDRRLAGSVMRDPVARARKVVRSTVDLFAEDPLVSRRMLRGWEESGQMLDRSPLVHLREALMAARADGVLRADVDVKGLAGVVGNACAGAMHQWASGLIDDAGFRSRSLLALDVALAAGAGEPDRERLARRLRVRR